MNDSHSLVPPDSRAIVVIDDDAAVRGSLQFMLETEGFPVRSYACGPDLLNDADPPACGCLVIDYRLPGMNGLELLSELRRRRITLPAILITSYPSASLTARTAAAGAALLEKPLLSETLCERIRAVMDAPDVNGQSEHAVRSVSGVDA